MRCARGLVQSPVEQRGCSTPPGCSRSGVGGLCRRSVAAGLSRLPPAAAGRTCSVVPVASSAPCVSAGCDSPPESACSGLRAGVAPERRLDAPQAAFLPALGRGSAEGARVSAVDLCSPLSSRGQQLHAPIPPACTHRCRGVSARHAARRSASAARRRARRARAFPEARGSQGWWRRSSGRSRRAQTRSPCAMTPPARLRPRPRRTLVHEQRACRASRALAAAGARAARTSPLAVGCVRCQSACHSCTGKSR